MHRLGRAARWSSQAGTKRPALESGQACYPKGHRDPSRPRNSGTDVRPTSSGTATRLRPAQIRLKWLGHVGPSRVSSDTPITVVTGKRVSGRVSARWTWHGRVCSFPEHPEGQRAPRGTTRPALIGRMLSEAIRCMRDIGATPEEIGRMVRSAAAPANPWPEKNTHNFVLQVQFRELVG